MYSIKTRLKRLQERTSRWARGKKVDFKLYPLDLERILASQEWIDEMVDINKLCNSEPFNL